MYLPDFWCINCNHISSGGSDRSCEILSRKKKTKIPPVQKLRFQSGNRHRGRIIIGSTCNGSVSCCDFSCKCQKLEHFTLCMCWVFFFFFFCDRASFLPSSSFLDYSIIYFSRLCRCHCNLFGHRCSLYALPPCSQHRISSCPRQFHSNNVCMI